MGIIKNCSIGIVVHSLLGFSVFSNGPTFPAAPGTPSPEMVQQAPPQFQQQPPQMPQEGLQPGFGPGQPMPQDAQSGQGYPGQQPGNLPQQAFFPGQGQSSTEQLNITQPMINPGTGAQISVPVFIKKGNQLSKSELTQNSLLGKAVVICVGDWCPHCANFLNTFAKYIEILRMYGINIIFLHVPSLEILGNWRDPTMEDYQSAEGKLQQYGIKADSPESKTKPAGVYLVMLGSKDALAKVNVSSLPTAIGSNNGRECFRHVGEDAVRSLCLSNPDILTNILKIFNKDSKGIDDSSKKGTPPKKGPAKGLKGRAKKSEDFKKSSIMSGMFGPVDRNKASKATQFLNDGVSSILWSRSPPIQHTSRGCSCYLH
ncbi:MAG: hypothetical protein LBL32_02965 [Holosporales bacterium]|jgi:thiol-disulfide isomerase/thioredoxin|nr:hypothetical protein [Holosporales bacterium]